jgi:cbb3-type cytochrome oxidase subunit 1
MPRLSVLFIRLALLYLLAGFTIGALMLANKGLPISPFLWLLLPAHIEFLLFGWTVQLAFGVAFWILPRRVGGSRGRVQLAWLALVLLNLGIWLAVLSVLPSFGQALADTMYLAGKLLQGLAAVAFAAQAWERVRATYS